MQRPTSWPQGTLAHWQSRPGAEPRGSSSSTILMRVRPTKRISVDATGTAQIRVSRLTRPGVSERASARSVFQQAPNCRSPRVFPAVCALVIATGAADAAVTRGWCAEPCAQQIAGRSDRALSLPQLPLPASLARDRRVAEQAVHRIPTRYCSSHVPACGAAATGCWQRTAAAAMACTARLPQRLARPHATPEPSLYFGVITGAWVRCTLLPQVCAYARCCRRSCGN
jgi:hypothetical protein